MKYTGRSDPEAVNGGVLQINCSSGCRDAKIRHDARRLNRFEEHLIRKYFFLPYRKKLFAEEICVEPKINSKILPLQKDYTINLLFQIKASIYPGTNLRVSRIPISSIS